MGFFLRKKETGHAGGRAVLCWRGVGCAGRAVLCWAWGLALVGVLGWLGRGFGSARRAGLGWEWDLAVLGGWAGLGVGFGSGGRAGWVGRGFGFLCMVYIVHVFFMMSLCLSSSVSQMCIMGLEQNKAWHW